MLLQKLETAKMTQRLEASREGTRYTIIDPPRLPLYPIKPNKPLVIFMGLLLGAAAGVGMAFAREFLDQSVLDIEDAKLTMDLPILGAISRITTQEEVARQTHRTRTAITIGVIIGAGLDHHRRPDIAFETLERGDSPRRGLSPRRYDVRKVFWIYRKTL